MSKTVAQYIRDAEDKINKIIRLNEPFERAVRNIVALQAKRIFIDGLKSDGSLIGQYSTKPIYVNPNTSSPRKTSKGRSRFPLQGLEPTVGKFGEHIFTAATAHRGVPGTKAGDPHRTTYLPGGVKELRNRTGRRIDKVNLTFTGELLFDFCNAKSAGKAQPHKISVLEYQIILKKPINQLKLEGLELKYGTISHLTKQEREAYFKTLDFNFRKALADG